MSWAAIRVHVYYIYDGLALQPLSIDPYNGCAFPQAHTLIFDLVAECNCDEDNEYTSTGADANILAFVQRIKEMAPRVNKVYLSITDMDGYLARLTAPTLQTINIWSLYDNVDISGLIRDPDGGNYVEYPCLYALTMKFGCASTVFQGSAIFNGAVPFPSLRLLVLNSRYPFSDDVVFRGNEATLEYLTVTLYSKMATLLKRYNVFTRISHPNLEFVNTKSLFTSKLGAFSSVSDYVGFILSIAPAASVHVIPSPFGRGRDLLPALSLLEGYASIQVLSLPFVNLPF
ncbi:hypothetical protein GGI17_004298 [Coemansia sp. S146]|nr:hypothetical protein GGI17_004298 [Coemansia sp. S146]